MRSRKAEWAILQPQRPKQRIRPTKTEQPRRSALAELKAEQHHKFSLKLGKLVGLPDRIGPVLHQLD